MKRLICLVFAALMISACAGTTPTYRDAAFTSIDQQCHEYAREMVGEADDEGRYRVCLAQHGY